MSEVLFPTTAKGDRSTTTFNKDVVEAVAAALGESGLVAEVKAEKQWRQTYQVYWRRMTEAHATVAAQDAAKAVAALRAGLAAATRLEVDGKALAEVMATGTACGTATITGSGEADTSITVPFKGALLTGAALKTQLDAWENACMEPDAAAAIRSADPATLKGRTFIVLGAGSELGPLRHLLKAGATVAAVATRKPDRWEELIKFTKETAGTLLLPVPAGTGEEGAAAAAGLDLIAEAPVVCAWALSVAKAAKGPVTLGTYLYADGEQNVRITAVADAIVDAVAGALGKAKVSFAWLASPSTAAVLPAECVKAQKENYENRRWWHAVFRVKPNSFEAVDGKDTFVYDGYMNLQGPNYALSQHMRQWRAMLLHHDGFVVSTPMAPACRTASVVGKKKALKWALDGYEYFPPLEAFDPDTACALLYAIMVHELAQQHRPTKTIFHIISRDAFHSGCWRSPYTAESIGAGTVICGAIGGRY